MLIKLLIDEARAVFSAAKDLYTFGAKIRRDRSAKFDGRWGNEGDCIGPQPSHYVELDLQSDGLVISGTIQSRKLHSETSLGIASFRGCRSGYYVTGDVTQVSQGRLLRFGEVQLHFKDGEIHFRGEKNVADFLPTGTRLWRQR